MHLAHVLQMAISDHLQAASNLHAAGSWKREDFPEKSYGAPPEPMPSPIKTISAVALATLAIAAAAKVFNRGKKR